PPSLCATPGDQPMITGGLTSRSSRVIHTRPSRLRASFLYSGRVNHLPSRGVIAESVVSASVLGSVSATVPIQTVQS
ncbi:hypothetical protein BaRGS_00016700, partial [Batillaria attramentaria]